MSIAFRIEMLADGSRFELSVEGPLMELHRPLAAHSLRAFHEKSAKCNRITGVRVTLDDKPSTIRKLRAFAEG